MLLGSEQLDAPASECGAIGDLPHSPPAGRANLSRERGHWSFDQAAYSRDVLALAYRPSTISAMLLSATAFCAIVMVAVALGAR